jgi:hypothetical protein
MEQSSASDPKRTLLKRWQRNCLRSSIGNYDAASMLKRRNYQLGVPAVFLTSIVGTSVFATLGTKVETYIQIIVGIISVLAAVLGALQTFLKWGELSSKHQAAAAEFNALKRYIDQILACHAAGDPIQDTQIDYVRTQMDMLARDTPELPNSIWIAARKKIPTEQERNLLNESAGRSA